MFAGTCHKCRKVEHKTRNCRRSVDLPKCSAKEAATTTDGQMKTWKHDPCYNPKEKSPRGSRCKSMAIKRPTNAIKSIADDLRTNLLREVSDKEKDLPDAPDDLHEPQAESQELQSLPVEGES